VADRELTPTSFVVLGVLEILGPCTPYDVKRYGQGGLFFFWSVPHTQIYSECARLAASGHLAEQREETGRRRRVFRLTDLGSQTLAEWRGDPGTSVLEVRDEGLLKLYLGADVGPLARAQAELHSQRATFLETVHEGRDLPDGMRAVFEAGVALEREFGRFWESLGVSDANQ
jgi:PadR family transcriptional regulator, regulatory protein AphA